MILLIYTCYNLLLYMIAFDGVLEIFMGTRYWAMYIPSVYCTKRFIQALTHSCERMQATIALVACRSFPPTWRWAAHGSPTCLEPNVESRPAKHSSWTWPTRQAQEVPIYRPDTSNTHQNEHSDCLFLPIIDLPKNTSTDTVCRCIFAYI